MNGKIEHLRKETKTIQKKKMKDSQMEILVLRNIWNKNSLDGLNSRMQMPEESISRLKHRPIEIIQSEK